MTANRQYLACKFRESDQRTYTYHNDGEPVAIGDRVVVSTNRGAQAVIVAEVHDQAPTFPTKAIAGKERQPALAGEPAQHEGN